MRGEPVGCGDAACGLAQGDEGEPLIEGVQRRGVLRLRDQDGTEIRVRQRREVSCEVTRARSIDAHDHTLCSHRGVDHVAPGRVLVCGSHGVLEIEDHGIGTFEGLLEALGPIRGAEQQSGTELNGPLADLEDLRVAVVTGDRELVHEPVAAEDLRRVPGVVHRGVSGDEFGDR